MTNTRELYELARKHGIDYPAIVEGLPTKYVQEQRERLVRAMNAEGMAVNAIATILSINRVTVRSAIACDTSN